MRGEDGRRDVRQSGAPVGLGWLVGWLDCLVGFVAVDEFGEH